MQEVSSCCISITAGNLQYIQAQRGSERSHPGEEAGGIARSVAFSMPFRFKMACEATTYACYILLKRNTFWSRLICRKTWPSVIQSRPSKILNCLQLIELISSLNRGVSADSVDQEQVEELVQGLEKINPTKSPLKSPLINGQWELIYTTSAGIVGTKKPPYLRPQGPIYQLIGLLSEEMSNPRTLFSAVNLCEQENEKRSQQASLSAQCTNFNEGLFVCVL